MEALSSSMTPLCFDRADFNRSDFNVEFFLGSLRRRVTFEQIQEDLRLYLKIVQNAMIELINQDYADFVNLSSNLVNLRQTVDKLEGDLTEISKEFEGATSELETAIGDLSVHLESKKANRNAQKLLEERIRVITLLKKLKSLVERAQKAENVPRHLTERISELVLSVRIAIDGCPVDLTTENHSMFLQAFQSDVDAFQKILDTQLLGSVSKLDIALFSSVLSGYEACRRRDAALAIFIAEFLEPSIQESLRSNPRMKSVEKLQTVFASLISLREKYQKELVEGKSTGLTSGSKNFFEGFSESSKTEISRAFLSDALLTVLLSVLDSHFGSVTIPTDADVFHQCYSTLLNIVHQWPDSGHPLLKMATRKFSLPVYYRMRCHEISQDVDKVLGSSVALPARGNKSRFHLEATSLINGALSKVWSDSVYLPPLTPKFWDLTCKLLTQYKQWTEKILTVKRNAIKQPKRNAFQPANIEEISQSDGNSSNSLAATNGDHGTGQFNSSSSRSSKSRDWEDLVRLTADVAQLESALFELAFEKIWPKVRSVGGETAKFGECLTAGVGELKGSVDEAGKIVAETLTEEMGQLLKEVSEVPRQYRWTRKEPPSQPSQYLRSAFAILAEFYEFAQNCFLSQEQIGLIVSEILRLVMGNYLEKVENVLVSVDKMSTSLSKLKRNVKLGSAGQQGQETANAAMTDDQKIRLQLSLDLAEFRKEAAGKAPGAVKIDWKILEDLEVSARTQGEGAKEQNSALGSQSLDVAQG